MLVHFQCRSVPTITMFGEHATTLLKLMGQSGVVPGGLAAADIPAASQRLRSALLAGKAAESAPAPASTEREREQSPVLLGARAQPLLDFFDRAAKLGADITWT